MRRVVLGCVVAIAADKEAVECSGCGDDGRPVNRAGGLKRLERMELREGREGRLGRVKSSFMPVVRAIISSRISSLEYRVSNS